MNIHYAFFVLSSDIFCLNDSIYLHSKAFHGKMFLIVWLEISHKINCILGKHLLQPNEIILQVKSEQAKYLGKEPIDIVNKKHNISNIN